MAGKIFVNYRRDDSASHALNVAQYLEREFGGSNVFLDIDRMRAGQKFPKVLEERLAVSKVMLAVIGPSWLTLKNDKGERRLDDPEDWVRLEIARALARGVPVIPVLVGGASLPRKGDLPDDLKPLVDHHVATITTNGFRNEMAGLARDIRDLTGGGTPWAKIAGGIAVAVVVATGLVLGMPLLSGSGPGPVSGPAEKDQAAAEIKRKAEEAAATEAKRKSDEAAAEKAKAEAEAAAAAAAEAKRKAEQRVAMLAEEERKRKEAEVEAKRKADEEAARKAAEEAARKAAVPKEGETFRDCPECPEMVVVRPGTFTMGSPVAEEGRDSDEGPQRSVRIAKPFAVGKYEVTIAEWDACVSGGGCKHKPDTDWGLGRKPVMRVSWDDAKSYVSWLSKKSGKPYRLLTEAEWEYAARAGTTTPFSTGRTITPDQANFDGNYTYGDSGKGKYHGYIIEVGSFRSNSFGLCDMHGNVWEWVEDCYEDSYNGAPTDGTAAKETSGCPRVLRGGSWNDIPDYLRSATRVRNLPDSRVNILGSGWEDADSLIFTSLRHEHCTCHERGRVARSAGCFPGVAFESRSPDRRLGALLTVGGLYILRLRASCSTRPGA